MSHTTSRSYLVRTLVELNQNSDIQIPLFKWGSDSITPAPEIIIVWKLSYSWCRVVSGLGHNSNNNNNQYYLLFLSLPTGIPQYRQFTLEPALSVELIRTLICEYHYSNRGETE